MQVIPVIDLKGGVVVRARLGERASYAPIETPLSRTSESEDVVAGLLSLHPFRTLYAADLDAIEGRGDSGAILDRLERRFPQIELWVDNGCRNTAGTNAFLRRRSGASLVLGSESQAGTELVRTFAREPRVLLSLDFRGDAFLGPTALLSDAALWPDRLIVMTLARVGSDAGPDFSRFASIKRRAGAREVYMAGGLRDRDDLAAVKTSGAAGILVASALHDGRLSPADLAQIV
jgi:phosphoribosylformimino-5-aminoimidazole carboxamide ribotide isomerase